jgi:hypothetical protein
MSRDKTTKNSNVALNDSKFQSSDKENTISAQNK